jgi:hypothetical protein
METGNGIATVCPDSIYGHGGTGRLNTLITVIPEASLCLVLE